MKKLALFFSCIPFLLQAGDKTDSLLKELDKCSIDTQRVMLLIELAHQYTESDKKKDLDYINQAFELGNKINFKRGLAYVYTEFGSYYQNAGDYPKAMESFTKGLQLADETNNPRKSIAIGINIGNIFFDQGDIKSARKYYQSAYDLAEKIDFKDAMANCIHNLAGCCFMEGNYDQCFDYLKKNIAINVQMGRMEEVATALGNLGALLGQTNHYEEAERYIDSSIIMKVKLHNINGVVASMNELASVFMEKGDYAKALATSYAAIDTLKRGNDKSQLTALYKTMSEIYVRKKDYEHAYEFKNKQLLLKDSLFKSDFTNQIAEMQAKYETEKKDKELLKKDSEIERQQSQARQQFIIMIAFVAGFVLMILLSVFIYRGYRQKQKANIEISHQKEMIEEKNKEILDSITYAKNLQDAILPPPSFVRTHFPSSFILFKPKDIVAGDFYWMETAGDHVFVAAADCTGHGVPGALVSVVCSNALNRALKEFRITDTGKILDKVRELVVETFEKSERQVRDGMDISLVRITKGSGAAQWSGANNPLWYLQNGEVKELIADKQPIGKAENERPFTTHTLDLKKGDQVYLFTDGYADQFGGEKGKKFKYKPMQELVASIAAKDPEEQKQILDRTIEEWRGDLEQVDDILIIGLRV